MFRFTSADTFGVRGGVEYAFMSCTTDREVAMQYSNKGYIFEMQTGMITRGASLSWLSFYPEEQEVCMPPCAALDVRSMNRMDHGAVVVDLNLVTNSNLPKRCDVMK